MLGRLVQVPFLIARLALAKCSEADYIMNGWKLSVSRDNHWLRGDYGMILATAELNGLNVENCLLP